MSEAQHSALNVVRSELILGGQKSGKSRRAEDLAARWLAASAAHRAVLIATAQAHDDEMRARIARHQEDRRRHLPRLQTVEAPRELAAALAANAAPDTLVLIDCLTLWMTAWLMPMVGHIDHQAKQAPAPDWQAQQAHFLRAIEQAPGPVVMVGNEIGLGVIPLGRETRSFVDALGALNQRVAAASERVTLMVAGLPLTLKGQP